MTSSSDAHPGDMAPPPDAQLGPGKLLYLITSGLSAPFLRGQLAFLMDAGYVVHVGANVDDSPAMFDDGVDVHHVDFVRVPRIGADVRSLFQTLGLIRKLRPTIVNASTPKAGLIGMLAAALLRVPQRVHVVRGLRYSTLSGPGRAFHRLLAKATIAMATDVVFNSRSLMDMAETDRIVRPGTGRVLGGGSGNGIDIERFADPPSRDEARRALDLPLDCPIIGFVGRLTNDKGVADLLAAFEQVRRTEPSVVLALIGNYEAGDPVARHDRATIDRSDAIQRRDWTDEPERVYAAFDVLAFPSMREGLPNVVLEAQAAGTPVVGYDAVGTRDAVSGISERWFVTLGDIPALGAAVIEVLTDDALRERATEENRRWVATQFDQNRVWSDLVAAYRGEPA